MARLFQENCYKLSDPKFLVEVKQAKMILKDASAHYHLNLGLSPGSYALLEGNIPVPCGLALAFT